MRYAVIMAGGSGTRLWPMSRDQRPKQLIPFIDGRCLVAVAMARIEQLVPAGRRFLCAGVKHRQALLDAMPDMPAGCYLGEPEGRDTLNAVALAAAVIDRQDPQAVIAVLTADHLIEPVDRFRQCLEQGMELAEAIPHALVTFGITPTHAATGYGYLELGAAIPGHGKARRVSRFKEKPDHATAEQYVAAGPGRYLWNSGMFVWRARALLDCVARYEPEVYAGMQRIAAAWGTDDQETVLSEVYPTLKKISVDFAVMEPASRDGAVMVAAVPMPLQWLDVGSWPSYQQCRPADDHGNVTGGHPTELIDCRGVLALSEEPDHLIAAIGCENLMIVHTADATLVCPAGCAEQIKSLYARVAAKHPTKA